MKWLPGTGPSAQFFIVSDCNGWCICKSGEPPVYTLSKLGGRHPELIVSGSLESCKERANEQIQIPHR